MPGRTLLSEDNLKDSGYELHQPDMVRRRAVLRETLDCFLAADSQDKYHALARAYLQRWSEIRRRPPSAESVQVLRGDWGEVTHSLTRKYGACFAVLNMANAYVPGGAYVEGASAQEENMFRRTDCHFHVGLDDYIPELNRYVPEMTALLSAMDGLVFLDSEHPRVCIRGPEDRSQPDLGYAWLADEDVYSFYELRAAAQDLRAGSCFSEETARQRIAAQLDTLIQHGVTHAVLGASGCGAFQNPAESVAKIYREEISKRRNCFSVIAFAIYGAGYGPDNFTPFRSTFGDSVVLG